MRLVRVQAPADDPPGPYAVLVAIRGELPRYGISAMLRDLSPLVGEVSQHDGPALDLAVDLVVVSLDEDCAAPAARAARRGVKVLGLAESVDQIARARVDGVLFRPDLTLRTLAETLTGVMRGETAPAPSRRLQDQVRRRALTPREREVLRLMAQGMSNKQIARRLAVSEHGIKKHVANVLVKLDSPNRTIAAVRALHDGLLA